jgi:uncharacterized protein (DUF1501 family)
MKRRDWLAAVMAATASWWLPGAACARAAASAGGSREAGYDNLLILVELKGGNDGLNTVVPFRDLLYYRYRPRIAVRRDTVIALDERTALHPSLAPLLSLWRARQLAIVQGVGYTHPNRSHFRSSEIWDTASRADQYLCDGWLTRAFAQRPVPTRFVADGVALGSAEKGPLANSVRAVALRSAGSRTALKTVFPRGVFGASIETAMTTFASNDHERPTPAVAAIRVTLDGFDTHHDQPGRHAALLAQFAAGMIAIRDALVELGHWDRTLIVTSAEFGRCARENEHLGTDHGAASAHFVAGGRVRGGLYGDAPSLAHVDGNGNLPAGVDFRRIYATVLGGWWGLDPQTVLQQRFEPLPLIRA